jgi:regulatory protein YycH of two-component signal transduction system YycFG
LKAKFRNFLFSVIALVVTSATTAFLDWSFAKITEIEINVPVSTPVGTYQQQIKVQQKRGRFSNHLYK